MKWSGLATFTVWVASSVAGTARAAELPVAAADIVIVTAQKREQAAVDVPLSISALKGERLETAGVRDIGDALNQVSGVNFVEWQPGFSTLSIRGATAGY